MEVSMKLYHGCSFADRFEVRDSIKLGGKGFHMTRDIEIAKGYAGQGGVVVEFEMYGDFDCHIGTINKGGDVQDDIASGIEFVLKTQAHLVSFYTYLWDANVVWLGQSRRVA